MRRLRRILLNAATGVSLLVCIATVVVWVRSYAISEQWQYARVDAPREVHGWLLRSECSRLILYRYHMWGNGSTGFDYWREPPPPGGLPRVDAFSSWTHDFGPSYGSSAISVSHWALAAVSAVLPTLRLSLLVLRGMRRIEVGLCPACGYDLRATPERCPECGRQPSS